MKDRPELWGGGGPCATVAEWVARQGTIGGLDLVDFNYPQVWLEGTAWRREGQFLSEGSVWFHLLSQGERMRGPSPLAATFLFARPSPTLVGCCAGWPARALFFFFFFFFFFFSAISGSAGFSGFVPGFVLGF